MSRKNGSLVTCDKCGRQVFLECTGEGERDGGFTRWNKFEPFPDGWKNHYYVGQLCPVCNKEFEELIENFLKGGGNDGSISD